MDSTLCSSKSSPYLAFRINRVRPELESVGHVYCTVRSDGLQKNQAPGKHHLSQHDHLRSRIVSQVNIPQ